MPLPKGLQFEDRLAPYDHPKHGAGYVFVCQRKSHPYHEQFIPGFKTDAKGVRAEHDTNYHVYGRRDRDVAIEQLCDEWLAHVEQLEVEKIRDPQTTRHYAIATDYLKRGMHDIGVRLASDLDSSRISAFIRWMRQNTSSKGSLIAKTLSALRTMLRWKWIAVDWKIPHDEIRAETREKKDLDAETIRKLIAAMPEGSLEQAVAYLKARTGARDVEILSAKKDEFDLDLSIDVDGREVAIGVFRPILHNKGSRVRKRHVYVITSDAVEKIRPFVRKAAPGGYVFTDDTGKPMTRELMRPRIRAASKAAGFIAMKRDGAKKNPVRIGAIDTLAQIRAEIATAVYEETSDMKAAAAHLGHADEKTTERWYVKNRLTRRKLIEKFRPAEIIANAIPLKRSA